MAKSKPSAHHETRATSRVPSACGSPLGSAMRVDAAHELASSPAESPPADMMSPALRTADQPPGEQIRLQADQLAAQLRARQSELDHREAELNSRIARLESEDRAARLWCEEREAELASREQSVTRQEKDLEQRLLAAAPAAERTQQALTANDAPTAQARRISAKVVQHAESAEPVARQNEEIGRLAANHLTRKQHLDEAEARLVEAQADLERLQEALSKDRQSFAEETAALRDQMASERREATAELEQERRAVQRRADHADQCRSALKQLRGELGRMHRETLEIRLATEELWAQISGAAPPAALTRSLGRIRTKLAEHYRHASAELAETKQELEAIRKELAQGHKMLATRKQQFEQWVAVCRNECQEQASRLVAREQQLRAEESHFRRQSQRWQGERLKLQQELRRLREQLVERDEAVLTP